MRRWPLSAGEEVLTNYGWDCDAQGDRKCGYNYHVEKTLKKKLTEIKTLDEEEAIDALGEEEGSESEDEV